MNNITAKKIDKMAYIDWIAGQGKDKMALTITIKYHNHYESFVSINQQLYSILNTINNFYDGNNWKRRKHLMALSFMFCDIAGTKRKRQSASNETNSPHHHGIIYIHSLHKGKMLPDSNATLAKIETIIVQKVKSVQSVKIEIAKDIAGWIDYAGKHYWHCGDNSRLSDDAFVIHKGNIRTPLQNPLRNHEKRDIIPYFDRLVKYLQNANMLTRERSINRDTRKHYRWQLSLLMASFFFFAKTLYSIG